MMINERDKNNKELREIGAKLVSIFECIKQSMFYFLVKHFRLSSIMQNRIMLSD